MAIREWYYQQRSANRMVDTLAKMAIDSRVSKQVTNGGHSLFEQHWDKVIRHMGDDMAPLMDIMDDTAQEAAVADSQ
ncbi:hypothetical protein PR001_g30230 [Phytophthora rubi]|uniref:RNase H type-1 domain-containing protein n=1 Tax=Phytophthora rubi TaxID=129364 RepID=A0A6A3GUU7_9STRA|nr:hypothetical protein PR001_g30230 [Phytophthora rubi]